MGLTHSIAPTETKDTLAQKKTSGVDFIRLRRKTMPKVKNYERSAANVALALSLARERNIQKEIRKELLRKELAAMAMKDPLAQGKNEALARELNTQKQKKVDEALTRRVPSD